jgi:hypothetical protein
VRPLKDPFVAEKLVVERFVEVELLKNPFVAKRLVLELFVMTPLVE